MKGFILVSTMMMVLLMSLLMIACIRHNIAAIVMSRQYYQHLQKRALLWQPRNHIRRKNVALG